MGFRFFVFVLSEYSNNNCIFFVVTTHVTLRWRIRKSYSGWRYHVTIENLFEKNWTWRYTSAQKTGSKQNTQREREREKQNSNNNLQRERDREKEHICRGKKSEKGGGKETMCVLDLFLSLFLMRRVDRGWIRNAENGFSCPPLQTAAQPLCSELSFSLFFSQG